MLTVISYLIFEESHKFIVHLPFRLFSIMDATPFSVPPVSEILKTATSITATDSIVDPETSDTALLTSAILPVANSAGLFDLDQSTHEEPLELLFLTGRKSGQQVAYDEHLYTRYRQLKNSNVYWRCREKAKYKYHGVLTTTGDSTGAVVLRVKEHRNHLKSYTTVQRAQLISTLKAVVFHDKPGQWNHFLSKYLMPALSASIQYFIFS